MVHQNFGIQYDLVTFDKKAIYYAWRCSVHWDLSSTQAHIEHANFWLVTYHTLLIQPKTLRFHYVQIHSFTCFQRFQTVLCLIYCDVQVSFLKYPTYPSRPWCDLSAPFVSQVDLTFKYLFSSLAHFIFSRKSSFIINIFHVKLFHTQKKLVIDW